VKIAFITLGCPKNLVDTEVMLGILAQAGHQFAGDPAEADVAIVSTCSFIAAAVQESREVIDGCLALKDRGLVERVVVAGCLSQLYGERTWNMFPVVDGVVRCSDFERIDDVVREVLEGRRVYRVGVPYALYDDASPRVLGTPAHLAYVKIADGCDNNCAYCTIPTLRGRLRSREPHSVVREVLDLVESGVREVDLIAQDTTAYGTDIASDTPLPDLLSALDDTGVLWVRVLYTHPAHVTEELFSAMAGIPSVVPYLDMPIQHISDRVLERMGRRTDGERIRALLRSARRTVPGIAIRSSVMTGFPGETEDDFRELHEFIRAGNIDHLGVFEFSPEDGTPACSMPGQVDAETASERARLLIEAMEVVTEARGRELVGRELDVMVDASAGVAAPAEARTPGQAWEMDGIVFLEGETGGLAPGDLARVTVTGARGFDLIARPSQRVRSALGGGETA